MEEMIWFLRTFTLFFIVFVGSIFLQKDATFTQSTTTALKWEPALRLILQNYTAKYGRLPISGETIEGKHSGEEIKIEFLALVPNEKVSLKITGLSHLESESLHIQFTEKENLVHIDMSLSAVTKPDLVSRIVFLFFGTHSLVTQANSLSLLLAPLSK